MTLNYNNNFNPLPWYNDISRQDWRKSYAYGTVYPLFAPANILLPFQIFRAHSTAEVTAVELYTKGGAYVQDITQAMQEAGLTVISIDDFAGYDVILYPANLYMATAMQDGQYYLRLTDGVSEWYSEVFTVVQDVTPYLCVEWWDDTNAVFDNGGIAYQNGYKNRIYLNTELGKPDYEFEEEGEDRDGYYFAEKQISEKTYKFSFLAPEYLCDAMRIARLSDYVRVTSAGIVYDCDTFLITPEWKGTGALASVEAEMQTDTVVKKIGKAYIKAVHGDYNDDYNNDYNND